MTHYTDAIGRVLPAVTRPAEPSERPRYAADGGRVPTCPGLAELESGTEVLRYERLDILRALTLLGSGVGKNIYESANRPALRPHVHRGCDCPAECQCRLEVTLGEPVLLRVDPPTFRVDWAAYRLCLPEGSITTAEYEPVGETYEEPIPGSDQPMPVTCRPRLESRSRSERRTFDPSAPFDEQRAEAIDDVVRGALVDGANRLLNWGANPSFLPRCPDRCPSRGNKVYLDVDVTDVVDEDGETTGVEVTVNYWVVRLCGPPRGE